MPDRQSGTRLLLAFGMAAAAALPARAQNAQPPHSALVGSVAPDGPVRTIRDALSLVARGGTIIVRPGTYRDSTIVVTIPVRIIGDGDAILDGEGVRQIMTVAADSVTVRGLHFVNVGVAFTEDLAAIKVVRASNCEIRDNRNNNTIILIKQLVASANKI